MLFEQDTDYAVVKSSQSGLMQHNLYSWEVTCNDVVRLDSISQGSRFIDKTLKEWIGGLDHEQRRNFTDALYEILNATEAKSIPELTGSWFKNTRIILQSLNREDESTRKVIFKTLSALLRAAKNNISALKPSGSSLPYEDEKSL
jgi:hypothetical protein